MTIYKYLPNNNYTKFDNNVLRINSKELSHGAKVVYVFLASLKNGKRITHEYINKSLGIGASSGKAYIKELKDFDLVLLKRVGAKQYDCYVGSTQVAASTVSMYWKELSSNDVSSLGLEDIKRLHEQNKKLPPIAQD